MEAWGGAEEQAESREAQVQATRVAYYGYNHKNADDDDVHAAHNYHLRVPEYGEGECVLMRRPALSLHSFARLSISHRCKKQE